MKRIYLDNAATTPMSKKVFRAMKPYLIKYYGNPSSLHQDGFKAQMAINEARLSISNYLGCNPNEIFFTSGSSESNSWVSKVYGCDYRATVHDSIKLANDNSKKNKFCAISLLNSETGISSGAEGLSHLRINKNFCHLDMTQAIGKIHINLKEFGYATASLSAHKFGGPKGIGLLYIREDKQKDFIPLIYGHQENGLRGGTENVPGIVGMAKALELTYRNWDKNMYRLLSIGTFLTNSLEALHIKYRNSYNVFNITFDNLNAQTAVMIFDKYGISVSAGSACNSGDTRPSEALMYYGYSEAEALKTIRVSLGAQNTTKDIKNFIKTLKLIIDKYDKA